MLVNLNHELATHATINIDFYNFGLHVLIPFHIDNRSLDTVPATSVVLDPHHLLASFLGPVQARLIIYTVYSNAICV